MGKFGVFSFHGTKTVTTGEGGMFVTSDEALFDKVTTLSNHGRASGQSKQFWPDEIGFKYKMSNIQAALGSAQMERIDELIASKRRIFNNYSDGLSKLPVFMNPEPVHMTNGYWMPTIVAHERANFKRAGLLDLFKHNNIDGRVFFWPLSDTGHFVNCNPTPVSHSVYSRALNLPSYHDMTADSVNRVCQIIRAFFTDAERP